MPQFLTPLDLNGSELRNVVVQNLGSDPVSPVAGRIWYNSTGSGALKYQNNSTTMVVASASDVVSNTLFDANTVLKADSDNTPLALTVAASTILGRAAAGGIDALTPSAARTVLGLGTLATLSSVSSSEITDGTIVNGDLAAAAGIALSKLGTQGNLTIVGNNSGGSNPPTALTAAQTLAVLSGSASATFSFNSQVVSGVATPASGTDAANKAYVDSTAEGLDIKASVRVAASSNVTIASPGSTIDGVTMAASDRVLLMGQTTGSENGIYTWAAAGSPMTRAADANVSSEVTAGLFTFVEEGTDADKGFVLATNNPIVLGTTALSFTQFSGSGSVSGTTNRITTTGSQVDIAATYVGQSSLTTLGTIGTGVWQGTAVGTAYGGTGATTAAGARSNLGATTKYTTAIGNGASTSFTVTHSLGSNDVVCELYDATSKQSVYADVVRASTNSLTISGFVSAPASNGIQVVVIG